jgi:hypothetical protein
VVVVAYGAHEALMRCVASIAGQDAAGITRLILVDNNAPGAECDAARVREAVGGETARLLVRCSLGWPGREPRAGPHQESSSVSNRT